MLVKTEEINHEEIKFLRQQVETALSKQENSNIGFCNIVMDNIYLATLLTLMTVSILKQLTATTTYRQIVI